MEKTTHSKQYQSMLELLSEKRAAANITQVEIAKRLKMTQSAYSKLERGELRLDLVQLRTILVELNVTLLEFVTEFENRIRSSDKRSPKR